MTCLLYLPFTRGLRSAQSVMRRVTINSGTLALYRADVVRQNAGAYENEHFWGRPMQMNDDSMLTFYALLRGDTVHQPSALVFTWCRRGSDTTSDSSCGGCGGRPSATCGG